MLLIHSMNSRGSASSGTGPPAKTVLMIITTSQTKLTALKFTHTLSLHLYIPITHPHTHTTLNSLTPHNMSYFRPHTPSHTNSHISQHTHLSLYYHTPAYI